VPSNAHTATLTQLLLDAEALDDAYTRLAALAPPPQDSLDAITRAVVVACVSAWEAFVEELVREAMAALRPSAPPLGVWSSHQAWVLGELRRFNTPNPENVRLLLANTLGLSDVRPAWNWPGRTPAHAEQDLTIAMQLRNQIAHGVSPRPTVAHHYSSQLPDFFRRLGLATDQAVRNHLVTVLGLAAPWPP
jgi:hypothetical protein